MMSPNLNMEFEYMKLEKYTDKNYYLLQPKSSYLANLE
jgi:hypothetical protein